MSKLLPPRAATLYAALAASSALALLAAPDAARTGPVEAAPKAAAERAAAAPRTPPSPLYRAAAVAAGRNDLAAASRNLAPLLAPGSLEAARARRVLGLLAWSAGNCAAAGEWLASNEAAAPFADWRLHALADCAGADAIAASKALAALIRDYPRSPLADPALVRLAELAWAASDAPRALSWIDLGRARGMAVAEAARLDALAFAIGRALGDPAIESDAARRLLVAAPIEASKLDVAGALAARGVDWRTLLTEEEILARSAALLAVDVPLGALTTLDAAAPAARGFRWRMLEARALVAAGRSGDALARLNGFKGKSADENAELLLLRAAAADEAATVRRGGPHPAAEERARLRALAHASLAAAADTAAAGPLRVKALTTLFAELESEGRMEEAIEVLRRLSPLDPAAQTGARALWERGWSEYRSANYSGAIGYWSELVALYPSGSYARSGSYWTARGHEALGERDRAASSYRELARVGTRDFYAQQSLLRLAGKPAAAPAESAAAIAAIAGIARDPWPEDRLLERARLLSDLGLDALARIEIDELAPAAEPRATAALRGLVLARGGSQRESLRELKRAFPRLGTALQDSVPQAALELYYPRPYGDRVTLFARAQGLPSSLVFGIIHQESGFDPTAKSHSGARGLMQIMPATGKELAGRLGMPFSAQSLYEPDVSLRLGTTYFRQLMGQFDQQVELALAGYNGGPGRIGRLWRAQSASRPLDLFLEDLSLEESRNYVKRIVLLAESYRSLYSDLT